MGQTLHSLANAKVQPETVFNNRFVVEICEAVHVHYRNLRILMSLPDWVEMARGFKDALLRWEQRGFPAPREGTHIELCRKQVAHHPVDDSTVKVNLNKNLYVQHEGRIFSDGAGISEKEYIHLKIRDLRVEMSIDEFRTFADQIVKAKENLEKAHV